MTTLRKEHQDIYMILLISLLYGMYFVLRYRGLWMENDTSLFTAAADRTISNQSVLFPAQYSHGFAYPAWIASLSLLTGLSPLIINTTIAPFIGVLVALIPIYLLYNRILRNSEAALVGILILFAIPDFMFSVLRGNHEKLNILFIIMSLYSLLKSYDGFNKGNIYSVFVWTVVYYVCVFSNIASNDYFGIVLLAANLLVAMQLRVGTGLNMIGNTVATLYGKLLGSLTTSILVFIWVTIYLFPTSGQDIQLFQELFQKIRTFTFSIIGHSSNPYVIASQQWISPFVSVSVSIVQYIFVAAAGVFTAIVFIKSLRRKYIMDLEDAIIFPYYISLALIVLISIPIDFLGLSAGANLELRNFTYLGVFAPLVIIRSVILLGSARIGSMFMSFTRIGTRVRIVGGVILSLSILLGLLKVTLDPTLSNWWLFYTPAEKEALLDFNQMSVSTAIWSGPDDRLVDVYQALVPDDTHVDQVNGYNYFAHPQNIEILMSQVVRSSIKINHAAIPQLDDMNRIYDNGGAQLYRQSPRSVMQN